MQQWVEELKKYVDEKVILIVVGTKKDLEESRKVIYD